jgi:hypothetical protein
MKNPIVKRKVSGLIIKGAAKKQAATLAKQRHKNWLKNKKPTVRGFNRTEPWVINQAGKATNKIPSGATSRKAMGHGVSDKAYGPVIPKPSAALKISDKAWKKTADRLERELKKKPKAVRKTTPPPQVPAPRAGAAVAVKPSARLPAVRPPVGAAAVRPPLSLKGIGGGKRQKIAGWKDLTKTQKAAMAAAGIGATGWGVGKMFGKDDTAAGIPAKPAQPAPPKKPASKIKDTKAIDAVERMLKDRGRDAVKWHPARVAREDPQRGDAKEAEKVAKSMKGKDPDWMDKFLDSMGIKKIKGPKDGGAGKRTYQIGGKDGKTFDVDSTPYEETLSEQELEQLEASLKKGGKIGKKVGKKKQGDKARKDESIAMRVKKKRTKKKLKASRDESYGKKGKGKINRSSGSALVASLYD